jgi:crotonobetainyl-CoA:carnitine CoA-transferase CaiB-like acyl-CoA transferase
MVDTRPAPLAGVRVVAVEQYGAGPFATLYLADLGAEVIKVEDPATGGDIGRYVPPGQDGTDSLFFEAFNRNKRSVALDLKSQGGREVFERLVAISDAVFSNLRGDQPERLGLTYPQLAHLNPRIVCVALTGYGRTAPKSTLPGYDALIQAESGWAAVTGGPDDPPTKSGLSLADYACGVTAALGLVVGVLDAQRTGLGRDVDTNLYDSALAFIAYPATWYLSSGFAAPRWPLSGHPSIVPFQFFRTADGYVAVATPKEKFFRSLVHAMDLSELDGDPRFASFAARRAHREELLEILVARFAECTTDAWLARLRGAVPIAPVRSLEEALDPDELTERDMLAEYQHPTFGTVRSVGSPLRFGGHQSAHRPGPQLGADTEQVLGELGYDQAGIEALRAHGAFGGRVMSGAPREDEAGAA